MLGKTVKRLAVNANDNWHPLWEFYLVGQLIVVLHSVANAVHDYSPLSIATIFLRVLCLSWITSSFVNLTTYKPSFLSSLSRPKSFSFFVSCISPSTSKATWRGLVTRQSRLLEGLSSAARQAR